MGNHRFRLSDMMPNAWFYKLKEMGGRRRRRTNLPKTQPPPSISPKPKSYSYPRKSYYFPRNLAPNSPNSIPQFHHPPTKSKPKSKSSKSILQSSSPKLLTSSVSADCTLWTNKSSDSPPDYSASSSSYSSVDNSFRSDRILPTKSFDKMVARSTSDRGNSDDIIINVDSKSLSANFDKLELSDLDLPPIITKPVQFDAKVEDVKKAKHRKSSAKYKQTNENDSLVKETKDINNSNGNSNRRHVNSPGLRLRVNTPRIGSRRISGGRKSVSSCSRRSLSDSLAVVKSSNDPQRDFRESMVEMIVENNIRASKDLEELLACYLSLNAKEYHQIIINVFKQIWFDFTQTQTPTPSN